MAFSSVEGLLQAAGQVPLWRAVLEDDLRERGVDEARSWGQMAALWTAMKAPVAEYDPAALVHVMGGTPGQMAHACAMALSNTLGLVCDPVAGLVEVPCVNRNVMGAVNALSCAEMALSGVESAIPCDEVIDAMRAVGDALPASLRETGSGGLAATPTGRRLAERL